MQLDHSRHTRRRGAFTLIELLTVIAIIGILAALLFPAIRNAMVKAEVAQARGDIKAIEAAIRQYMTEYGKLPVQDTDQGVADKWYDTSTAFNVYNILRAVSQGWNAGDKYNPRKIVFLETPSRKNSVDSSGNIVDPWGKVYHLKLDNNYNTLVEYFTGGVEKIPVIAVVTSFGPDASQCTQTSISSCDDLVNYQ